MTKQISLPKFALGGAAHNVQGVVAYSDYPNKTEAGYLTSRRCKAPCGGWIVVYDRRKGGPAGMKASEKTTGRYIIVVRGSEPESKRWVGVTTQAEAKAAMMALAKGENVGDLLPQTFVPRETFVPQAATASTEAPPSRESDSNSPRARVEDIPDALAIQRELNARFGAQRIADEIEEGLKAEKSYVTGKGETSEVVTVPDHATRVKYLDLLAKYRIGIPEKRDKPQEPKRMTFSELEAMCVRSPAARRSLMKMLKAAENQAAEQTK